MHRSSLHDIEVGAVLTFVMDFNYYVPNFEAIRFMNCIKNVNCESNK